jgi:hypothetical protein
MKGNLSNPFNGPLIIPTLVLSSAKDETRSRGGDTQYSLEKVTLTLEKSPFMPSRPKGDNQNTWMDLSR